MVLDRIDIESEIPGDFPGIGFAMRMEIEKDLFFDRGFE
jgi:hypothetical protein